MAGNENTRKLFEKFVSNEISEEEKQSLNSMLSSNPELREEFELWKQIDRSLKKTDTIDLRNQLAEIVSSNYKDKKTAESWRTILKNKYSIAAVIILIVVSAYSLYHITNRQNLNVLTKNDTISNPDKNIKNLNNTYYTSDTSENEVKAIKIPTSEKTSGNEQEELATQDKEDVTNNNLLAMNYTESSYFESYIGDTRSINFEIIIPDHAARFKKGDEIVFNWNTIAKDNIYLIILNNKEEEVYNNIIDNIPFTISKSLTPGLYYWKVETEDDLLHFDKFYVD